MKIEVWNLDRIRPYPNNPRINDDAVDAVAASIREFGVRQAIVVDSEGVIICGHTRFKAAQKLGLEKLPVHVAKDLTPEQIGFEWFRFVERLLLPVHAQLVVSGVAHSRQIQLRMPFHEVTHE
jgi:hypothetical protein